MDRNKEVREEGSVRNKTAFPVQEAGGGSSVCQLTGLEISPRASFSPGVIRSVTAPPAPLDKQGRQWRSPQCFTRFHLTFNEPIQQPWPEAPRIHDPGPAPQSSSAADSGLVAATQHLLPGSSTPGPHSQLRNLILMAPT